MATLRLKTDLVNPRESDSYHLSLAEPRGPPPDRMVRTHTVLSTHSDLLLELCQLTSPWKVAAVSQHTTELAPSCD